jgi:hypothetical protein
MESQRPRAPKDTFRPVLDLVLLAQSDLPSPSGDFRVSPGLFIVVFGIGFLLGIFGHLFQSRTMVACGVTLIFLTTVLLPIALAIGHA